MSAPPLVPLPVLLPVTKKPALKAEYSGVISQAGVILRTEWICVNYARENAILLYIERVQYLLFCHYFRQSSFLFFPIKRLPTVNAKRKRDLNESQFCVWHYLLYI